jgi:CheY-like chemotaxis protein
VGGGGAPRDDRLGRPLCAILGPRTLAGTRTMSSDEKRPLGKILLQRKLVSQQALDAALRTQRRSATPAPLASQLVDDGTVEEVDVLRALSEQHGIPGIDLTRIAIALEYLDVVPRDLSAAKLILPVLIRDDRIFLAIADPQEKNAVDEIEFVTGKKVYSYIAVHATLVKTIAAAYDAKARGERHYFGPHVPAETLRQLGLGRGEESGRPASAWPPARATPPSDAPDAVVVDAAVETAQRTSELSTSEFGIVSEEDSGAEMLPNDPRARATQAADAVPAGGGKLILVVDDEDEIRQLLKRLLLPRGYRVIEADRGLLALRLVKKHLPGLIILDAMLPELHGFDIARRIKGSAKYGHIPIIMVSAVYRGGRVADDFKQNYGVEEYLEKPFRVASVLDAVARLLPLGGEASAPSFDPEHLSAEAEKALRDGIDAYKAGQSEAAIEHLKRGVGIDPLSYRLHFHLALLLGKKGQVCEGIQELERAIDLNPTHFSALKNLAVLYEQAGFKNKATEMWARCIAQAPDEATRGSVQSHLRQLLETTGK